MIRSVEGDGSLLEHPRPLFFPEMALAHRYCLGEGLELGAAAHNPFNLPGCRNVAPHAADTDHAHRKSFELFRDLQLATCNRYVLIDLVGVADDLPVEDDSQDYIVSSHVVEHLPNVIGAFLEWKRVLRPGGAVLMIVPKRGECDRGRPITPLAHFREDFERGHDVDSHPRPPGQSAEDYHYHVFSLWSLMRLIDHCNERHDLGWEIVAAQQTDSKVGNGHTVVAIDRGRRPTQSLLHQAARALVNGYRHR